MVANAYIELWDSTSGSGGQFRVIQSGRKRILQKTQTKSPTIGGGLDITMGNVYETHDYIIRVSHDDPEAGYADYGTLEYLYRLNNPNGVPSNVITFTDHYGDTFDAYLTGDFYDDLLGCEIEGEQAWWTVRTRIEIKPTV